MSFKISERQKIFIVYLLIALTTIPFFFAVNIPHSWALTTTNVKPIALYISAVAGYIGIGLLLWEFILGTRSVTGLYFNDISKTIKVHHNIGKYGILLILLHPIFITISYGESLFYSLVPNISGELNRSITYGRLALYVIVIIWVTSVIARGSIKYRPWKYVHYLAYVILPLMFLHVPDTGTSYKNTVIQFYWYSFVVVFLVFLALRARHVFGYGKLGYNIISQKQITDDTLLLKLSPVYTGLTIKPGQFIYIQRSLFSEEHPFSVVDSNPKTNEILVAYKTFGKYTKKLAKMQAGDQVLIDGPYGVFTRELHIEPNQSVVFVAGGIGITPFIKYILDKPAVYDYKLFYANKTKQTAVFRLLLQQKLGTDYIDILSGDKSPASTNDERGFISVDILSKYLSDPRLYHYYICGPQAMMDSTVQVLAELGVPSQNIHLEKFSF